MEAIRAANARPGDDRPGTHCGSYAFSVFSGHPSGHAVTQLDPYAVRPERAPVCALAPAEKYGASTRTILGGLGYSSTQIDEMIAAKAVSESWSREYLPG
jgi:hypothetical protein